MLIFVSILLGLLYPVRWGLASGWPEGRWVMAPAQCCVSLPLTWLHSRRRAVGFEFSLLSNHSNVEGWIPRASLVHSVRQQWLLVPETMGTEWQFQGTSLLDWSENLHCVIHGQAQLSWMWLRNMGLVYFKAFSTCLGCRNFLGVIWLWMIMLIQPPLLCEKLNMKWAMSQASKMSSNSQLETHFIANL